MMSASLYISNNAVTLWDITCTYTHKNPVSWSFQIKYLISACGVAVYICMKQCSLVIEYAYQ